MEDAAKLAIRVAASLLAFCAASAKADITVVSWGGTYTVSQQNAYGEAWHQRTGKTIRWVDYNGGLGEIRAQVEAGNVLWDIFDVFPHDARFPGERPETIADFFDLERFPGKRGIGAFPQANIEMSLVADGVDPKEVYEVMDTPEGIDRTFAKLDTIKDHAVFWSSGVEPIELDSAYSAAYTALAKVNAQAAIGEHAFAENLEIYWKEG